MMWSLPNHAPLSKTHRTPANAAVDNKGPLGWSRSKQATSQQNPAGLRITQSPGLRGLWDKRIQLKKGTCYHCY